MIVPFLIFLLIITINLGSLKLFLLLLNIFGFFITGFLDDYLSIKKISCFFFILIALT